MAACCVKLKASVPSTDDKNLCEIRLFFDARITTDEKNNKKYNDRSRYIESISCKNYNKKWKYSICNENNHNISSSNNQATTTTKMKYNNSNEYNENNNTNKRIINIQNNITTSSNNNTKATLPPLQLFRFCKYFTFY